MQITHNIDSFLPLVFPELLGDMSNERIISVLTKYYTSGPYKPKVSIDGKSVMVDIEVEIAMQGAHGYKTDGTVYRLANVPGKKFSGYQILAWYYVSWALSMPEMLTQLQLPFDREYEVAKGMIN